MSVGRRNNLREEKGEGKEFGDDDRREERKKEGIGRRWGDGRRLRWNS